MTPQEMEKRKASNKKILAGFAVVLAVMVVAGIALRDDPAPLASDPTPVVAPASPSLPGTPLRVVRMEQQFNKATSGKRAILTVTAYPLDDQSQASQADLAATAMQEALATHARLAAPIIDVWIMAQELPDIPNLSADARGVGNLPLARAIYIADGMGGDGKTASATWTGGGLYGKDNVVEAVPRGFSVAELEYLRLYRSLYDQYATNGILSEDGETRIGAAIAEKMGIEQGSIKPFWNTRQPVKVK